MFGSPKGSPIDKLAASIDALCFLQGIEPTWRHVSGHSGHPWNEVADYLARQQLKETIGGRAIAHDLVRGMLREEYMQWLWMAVAASEEPACWPVAQADGSFSSSIPLPRHHVSPEVPKPETMCQHVFHIRAVTYNTLSLRAAGQSECLEQHFGNNGCCVLGLQECRQDHDSVEQIMTALSMAVTSLSLLPLPLKAKEDGRFGCPSLCTLVLMLPAMLSSGELTLSSSTFQTIGVFPFQVWRVMCDLG